MPESELLLPFAFALMYVHYRVIIRYIWQVNGV